MQQLPIFNLEGAIRRPTEDPANGSKTESIKDMAHITDVRIGNASVFSNIAALRDTLAARYAQYRVYRTTLTELQSLSKRDLADLGMHPSAIVSIAHEAAYGTK